MKQFLIVVSSILVVSGMLAAQDVNYNFDESADFAKYKTYRWEKHPQSIDVDELTLRQMGAAFEAELAKKGLAKAASGPADLVIVYQLAIKQEKQITSFDTGFGYGPGWRRGGWYGGGGGMTTASTSTLSIGSVALDMFDAGMKQLVWRGVASKTLQANVKPDKQQKNMAKAAEKLLKNYPPKKKK